MHFLWLFSFADYLSEILTMSNLRSSQLVLTNSGKWNGLTYTVCLIFGAGKIPLWIHRRMLRIPLTDVVSNADVLQRARANRELFSSLKVRKISYLGHVLRGDKYHLLQQII